MFRCAGPGRGPGEAGNGTCGRWPDADGGHRDQCSCRKARRLLVQAGEEPADLVAGQRDQLGRHPGCCREPWAAARTDRRRRTRAGRGTVHRCQEVQLRTWCSSSAVSSLPAATRLRSSAGPRDAHQLGQRHPGRRSAPARVDRRRSSQTPASFPDRGRQQSLHPARPVLPRVLGDRPGRFTRGGGRAGPGRKTPIRLRGSTSPNPAADPQHQFTEISCRPPIQVHAVAGQDPFWLWRRRPIELPGDG